MIALTFIIESITFMTNRKFLLFHETSQSVIYVQPNLANVDIRWAISGNVDIH